MSSNSLCTATMTTIIYVNTNMSAVGLLSASKRVIIDSYSFYN